MAEQIKIDDFTSLQIEEYNGKFSIVEGWIGRDDTFKASWCEREFGPKDAKEKKRWPVKVKCGSKSTLLALANYILFKYGEEERQPGDDETPF